MNTPKLEFVLFFSNEYFGIKVDLDGKKKKKPGDFIRSAFSILKNRCLL